VTVDRMPGIRHADALLAADQQLLAKMLLQRRQLLTQGRLRNVQDIRGAGDAAAIDDHNE